MRSLKGVSTIAALTFRQPSSFTLIRHRGGASSSAPSPKPCSCMLPMLLAPNCCNGRIIELCRCSVSLTPALDSHMLALSFSGSSVIAGTDVAANGEVPSIELPWHLGGWLRCGPLRGLCPDSMLIKLRICMKSALEQRLCDHTKHYQTIATYL